MPGDHFGDYVQLNIDLDTGRIEKWRVPSQDELDQVFSKEEE